MPHNSQRKPKDGTPITVALIALVGTIIAAIFASPWLGTLLQKTPVPTITSSPTSTSTSTPLPTATPTFTLTPSPTIVRIATSTPTAIPTPTVPPPPECIAAKVNALSINLKTGWHNFPVSPQNSHITSSRNEINGLTILIGKAVFDDPNVVRNCTCSWKGRTDSDPAPSKNVSVASSDCSFSLPLTGNVNRVELLLSVAGRPVSTLVIDFP
jgi:hypothetical protein